MPSTSIGAYRVNPPQLIPYFKPKELKKEEDLFFMYHLRKYNYIDFLFNKAEKIPKENIYPYNIPSFEYVYIITLSVHTIFLSNDLRSFIDPKLKEWSPILIFCNEDIRTENVFKIIKEKLRSQSKDLMKDLLEKIKGKNESFAIYRDFLKLLNQSALPKTHKTTKTEKGITTDEFKFKMGSEESTLEVIRVGETVVSWEYKDRSFSKTEGTAKNLTKIRSLLQNDLLEIILGKKTERLRSRRLSPLLTSTILEDELKYEIEK